MTKLLWAFFYLDVASKIHQPGDRRKPACAAAPGMGGL
jgi:hypothetical protein